MRLLVPGAGNQIAPRLSPDGRLVAFGWTRPGQPSQIYVVPRGGGEPRRITSDPLPSREPAWSPDGAQLVFHRPDGLWIAPVSGDSSPARRVPNSENGCCADWSPDGSRIAFVAAADAPADSWTGAETDLWLITPDGSGRTRLTSHAGGEWYPRWSRDGTHVVFYATWFDRMTDIWSVRAADGALRRLTDHPAEEFRPVPARDHDGVVFSSRRSGRDGLWSIAPGDTAPRQIHDDPRAVLPSDTDGDSIVVMYSTSSPHLAVIDASTGQHRRITRDSQHYANPDVSPDGGTVVFETRRFSPEDGLAARDVDGGAVRPLVVSGISGKRAPAWSADGRRIAFVNNPGGFMQSRDLWIADADGSNARRLTYIGGAGRAVWLRGDSAVAFGAWGEVWRVELASGRISRVAAPRRRMVPTHYLRGSDELVLVGGGETVLLGLRSGMTRRLSLPPEASAVRFSPEGRRLAFLAPDSGSLGLFVADHDGSGARRIAPDLPVSSPPAWMPDGASLMVSADPGEWKVGMVAQRLRYSK